jgi:hypothetical protein
MRLACWFRRRAETNFPDAFAAVRRLTETLLHQLGALYDGNTRIR